MSLVIAEAGPRLEGLKHFFRKVFYFTIGIIAEAGPRLEGLKRYSTCSLVDHDVIAEAGPRLEGLKQCAALRLPEG